MQTPGIAHVAARIREIQSRVESPTVPGQFRDMLQRSLQSESQPSANADLAAAPADEDHHPPVARFQAVQATTLGMMLGVSAPLAVPQSWQPITGIATRGELREYLAVHDIEARNGRLTDADLVGVSGGWYGNARLLPPAATAWEEMRAAAAIEGIDLKVIDSYRSWARIRT